MRLKEHPKIQWPPAWSETGQGSLRGTHGILRDVDLIESNKLLLSSEVGGKLYFAEIHCFNSVFATRLHERIKAFVGKPLEEVGEVDF